MSRAKAECEGPYAFWTVPFLALIHVQTWNAVTYTIVWVWGNHWVGVEDGGFLQQKHTWQVTNPEMFCCLIKIHQVFQMSNDPNPSLECLFYTDRTIGLPRWYGNVYVPLQGSRINQSKLQRSNRLSPWITGVSTENSIYMVLKYLSHAIPHWNMA